MGERRDGWDWEPDAEDDGEWVEASAVPGTATLPLALSPTPATRTPANALSLSHSPRPHSPVSHSPHAHETDPDSPHTALLLDSDAIPLNATARSNGSALPTHFGSSPRSDAWLQRLSSHRASPFALPSSLRTLSRTHLSALALILVFLLGVAGYGSYSMWVDSVSSDYQFDAASDPLEMERLALFFHHPDAAVVKRNIVSILATPEDVGLPTDPADPKYVDMSYEALFPPRMDDDPPRLVVSMSTFPGRVEFIKDTIESLHNQTRKPDRIYIHMPLQVRRLQSSSPTSSSSSSSSSLSSSSSSEDDLDVDALSKRSSSSSSSSSDISPRSQTTTPRRPPLDPILAALVRELNPTYLVVTHPPDFGPSTKLLPTIPLEPHPSTAIVTVDDDTTYHPSTMGALERTLRAAGGDHHAAFQCEVPYRPWFLRWWGIVPFALTAPGLRSHGADPAPGSTARFEPTLCSGFACAFAGTGFLRGQFRDSGREMFDYRGAPMGCRLHDDVWISGNLWRWGVTPVVVDADFWSVIHHRSYTNLTIHRVRGVESQYRDPCIEYFEYFRKRVDVEDALEGVER